MITIDLTKDELATLCIQDPNTEKDGGYQGLMVALQRRAKAENGKLTLTETEIERIQRYAFSYNQGGWQERLKEIFSRTLGEDLSGK